MSLISDRMQWPYPAEDENPWYDTFQSLVVAMDASGYANREDRHRIVSSDANVTFIASSGVLSWDAPIDLVNAISGHKLTIPAGNISLADTQMAYVVVTRGVLTDQNVTLTVATSVPNTDDAQLFCFRGGASVYFIRGNRVTNGQTINPWAGGGGGGGSDLSNVAPLPAAATAAAGTSVAASRGDHVHPTLPIATQSAAGYLSAADKKRVDGVTYDFVADFGADPTGAVNIVPSWNTAMTFFWSRNIPGGKLKIPDGTYKALSDLHVVAPMVIEGEGGGILSNTKINLAAGARFIVDSFGSAQTAGYANGQRGEFSSVRDIAFYGTVPPVWTAGHTPAVGDCVINTKYLGEFTQMIYRCVTVSGPTGSIEPTWTIRNETHGYVSEGEIVTDGGVTWKAVSSPGIWMKGTAFLSNLYFESLPGDGIYVYGYIANGGNPEGETATSGFKINDCQAQLCLGRGLYVEGTDSQGSNVVGMLVQNCNSGGIYDNSDVGNLYLGCLTETNGLNIWGPTGFTATLGSLIVPQVLTMDAQFNAGAVHYYKCISSGPTSGGAEPTWPTTIGATVVDGSATWQCAGLYTYGQSLKNRRAGTNGSIFLGCYEEPDQRLSEVDHPGMVIGSIGGQQTISRAMNALNLRNGRSMSSLTYISKENGSPRIRSTLGSQDGTSPVALEMQKVDGTADYQTLLGESGLGGEAWFKICAGQIAYWLTAENAPEGPGRAVFFNGLHLGTGFGNTTAGAAMRLWTISQSNSQVLPTGANRGDFIFNRDAAVGGPLGWTCTTGAHPTGAVWTPVHHFDGSGASTGDVVTFDGSKFAPAPASGGGGTGLPPGWINVRDFGAMGNDSIKTTGSITSGSHLLTVADASKFAVGCYVTVAGAAATRRDMLPGAGMLYDARVTDITGNLITLSIPATATVVGAVVQVDDWPAFHAAMQTMDHPLQPPPNYVGPFASGTRLYVPPGEIVTLDEEAAGNFNSFHSYRMSRQFDIDHKCIIEGAHATSTSLVFDDACNGVVSWSNNNSPVGGSADTSQIRNLMIKGPCKVSNPPSISGGFYGPQREASTSYAVGDTVSANTYARNLAGRSFKCIVAGTTAAGDASQPAFDTIHGTSGHIDPASNALTVADPSGFAVNDWITVETFGFIMHARITAIVGSVFTLSAASPIGIGAAYFFGAEASVRKAFTDGTVVWADIDAHGILNYCKTRFEDCLVTGFAGNGYACISSVPTAGNSNNAQVHTCVVYLNGGNGYYCHGNDANMILFVGNDAYQNGGWGIVDDSFLGNRWSGNEMDDNLRGSHWMDHGELWGGYAEGGQGPVYIGPSATVLDTFTTDGVCGRMGPPKSWVPSTVYSIGDRVRPTTPNGYIYVCLNLSGVSGGSEPIWPAARGHFLQDGANRWYAYEYDIAGGGFIRNGRDASHQIWQTPESTSDSIEKGVQLEACRYPDEFMSWTDFGDPLSGSYGWQKNVLGFGWQGPMYNRGGVPAFAMSTARAVDAGTADAPARLAIPAPFLIGSPNTAYVKMASAAAIPTTEHWQAGSVVWNIGYDGTNSPAWLCSVTGTPGTWVPLTGGAGLPAMLYSPINMASAANSLTAGAGDLTLATKVVFTKAKTVTGVRFGWAGGAGTVKVSLWTSTGTRIATGDVAVTGAGVKLGSFTTPYVLLAADVGKAFYVSYHDDAGASYTNMTDPDFSPYPSAGALVQSDSLMQVGERFFAAGDTFPNTSGGAGGVYPVEPVYL